MIALAVQVGAALVAACSMELWAALLHGRVWHKLLWPIHRSHHRERKGAFEANDGLSVLHAPIAIALILYGCVGQPGLWREACFGFGLGMTAFGLAYLLVHDGLVHGRLPVAFLARWGYLARVRDAHRVHHAHGREPHGLFLGPWVLARRAASEARAENASASTSTSSTGEA